jgi:hypothetical protein
VDAYFADCPAQGRTAVDSELRNCAVSGTLLLFVKPIYAETQSALQNQRIVMTYVALLMASCALKRIWH